MKKITLLTICFIIAILGGCQNIFTGNSNNPDGGGALPDGYGALRVSFARAAARTAIPDRPVNVWEHFELKFYFNENEVPQSADPDGDTYTFTLPEGTYTLRVEVWQGETIVAEGSAKDIVISEKKLTPVTLSLNPKEAGTGTLAFRLIHTNMGSADFYIGAFTLSPVFGDDPPIDALGLEKSPDDEKINLNTQYTVNVLAGYYMLSMTLVKQEQVRGYPYLIYSLASISEVVHIYQTLGTTVAYDFTNISFIENIVTNTLDYNNNETPIPGSLSYAIARASALSVKTAVRVMLPPGSEIKLKESLVIKAGNLVIEGNGIILTKTGESWEGRDYRKLMVIEGPSTTAAISRVHFKDGEFGAIENKGGSLSVESCIFSNNIKATASDTGAIYNTKIVDSVSGEEFPGTLTVKGCTFYDNRFNGGGWAIYALGGDINLTGNLFFGITTGPESAIFMEGGSTSSGDYNVVSTDLPFSPKTFRLFKNSPAEGVIPGWPANYPEKDFYGETIKSLANISVGAVQGTIDKGYYLDLDSGRGRVTVEPESDDFIFPENQVVTLTARHLAGSEFTGWQVSGESALRPNEPLTLKMDSDKKVKAVFSLPPVTSLRDDVNSITNMTLHYALSIAEDGDKIRFKEGLVKPGKSEIRLARPLPSITKKNITIEGSGVILISAYGYSSESMMRINAEDVTISGVHFTGGSTNDGGAIYNEGSRLTLESCVFSGNSASGSGGSIYNAGSLDVKGCTFYKNTAPSGEGGAIYNDGGLITLTGNLFNGNTSEDNIIASNYSGTITSNGYNVVDLAFGTASNNCGWNNDTGKDKFIVVSRLPLSPKTFRLFPNTDAVDLITDQNVLNNYPKKDFYGNDITTPAAAGAVQTNTGAGFYLDLEISPIEGKVSFNPKEPDEDGLVQDGTVLTVEEKPGYSFSSWDWGDDGHSEGTTLSLTGIVSNYIAVRANFGMLVTEMGDGPNSGNEPGTLRYTLANTVSGGTIKFKEKDMEITLTRPLETYRSLTIEGNGLKLTRSANWPASTSRTNKPLLKIVTSGGNVTIKRVHFTEGRAAKGGAIYSEDTNLTIESCIFSNNTASDSGGAIHCFKNNYGYDFAVKGCTFYSNKAGNEGGAIYYFNPYIYNDLTLTGNLFYGNKVNDTSTEWQILYTSTSLISSYNVVDLSFGTTAGESGWDAGLNDKMFTNLGIPEVPINTGTFKPVLALNSIVPSSLLSDNFPLTDFYGNHRFGSEDFTAPGAVSGY